MRIHVLQLSYDDDETPAARRERVADLVRRQQGADLVVLPELWAAGGFSYRTWSRDAEPVEAGPTVKAVREAARDLGCFVHAGSVVEDATAEPGEDGHGLYNTAVLLGRDGEVLTTYRKVHRFGFGAGEPRLMDPGSQVVTVPLPGVGPDGDPVVVGLATCYDLRFPEMFRALLDRGAEVVLVPAAWPAARISHWTLLGRARALENQSFLVGANTAGTHARTPMGGRSLVAGPTGEVLAEAAPEGEQVLVVDVDLAELRSVRESFPVLGDRRLPVG